jgi:hypothetical protein
MAKGLCGLVLEEGDQVIAVLGLLETTKGHLGARNVLLGVLEVLELSVVRKHMLCMTESSRRTRVDSSQVMPFCLLASVYEKPST